MKRPTPAPKRQGNAPRLPSDKGQCPSMGVTLDKLIRPAVLTVLAGGDMHGYAIVQRIGEMSIFRGQSPDAAGVYRTLRAMEREGMLSCHWDTSGRGPAKREYRITPPGRKCMEQWAMTLEQYRQAIGDLLEAVRLAGGGSGACVAGDAGGTPPRRACCGRGRSRP